MNKLCESFKMRVRGLSVDKLTPNMRRLILESDFALATIGLDEPISSQSRKSGSVG